jgi:hypothetical protein
MIENDFDLERSRVVIDPDPELADRPNLVTLLA